MLQELIKLAVKKINSFGQEQYIITEGDEENAPHILRKRTDSVREIVVDDLDCIISITATDNTLMLYEDGCINIISPGNYTYHEVC